jgi:hypothetical protein
MQVGKAVTAHVVAMIVAQLIILTGAEAIMFGPSGVLSGVMKSLGGVLILLIVAGVTLPVGLSLRWLAGKLPAWPSRVAVSAGVLVGLMTIPPVHPSTDPSVSFGTHPVALPVWHVLAGACGGWVWYCTERPVGGHDHA